MTPRRTRRAVRNSPPPGRPPSRERPRGTPAGWCRRPAGNAPGTPWGSRTPPAGHVHRALQPSVGDRDRPDDRASGVHHRRMSARARSSPTPEFARRCVEAPRLVSRAHARGPAKTKGALTGVPGFPHLRPTRRRARRRPRSDPQGGRARTQGAGVRHAAPAVPHAPARPRASGLARPGMGARPSSRRPAAVLTRPQDTAVFAPSARERGSGPGRASHSAMARAIGWPVSTSTKPNCPDWLHSRNHQVPSESSAKSKAP